MKRKNVIMIVLAATVMVSAFPAYAAIKAEAEPEGTAVAVKAEAKPERAKAVAMQISTGPTMPELPVVPLV